MRSYFGRVSSVQHIFYWFLVLSARSAEKNALVAHQVACLAKGLVSLAQQRASACVLRTEKQQKRTKNAPQTKRRAAGKPNRKRAPRAKKKTTRRRQANRTRAPRAKINDAL
jgi:hypothetical protein